MNNQKEKSVLERLIEINPEAEIWWDSSPLIYEDWCLEVLKEISSEEREIVSRQLERFYNSDDPIGSVFKGVTTNPSLSMSVFEIRKTYWENVVDSIIDRNQGIEKEDLFWLTYKEVIKRGAEMYMPLFEKSEYKYGYISAQVDPRDMLDEKKMIDQAMDLVKLSPNIMIKVPGTREGYSVIKKLTSMGIPTNNTLSFILPQFMACANAVKEGLEIAKKNRVKLNRWRSVITDMMARYGDLGDLRGKAKEIGIDVSEAEVRWAELAIMKKAHRILHDGNYPGKMLACSMRISPPLDDNNIHVWHLEKLAGGDFVYTCPPKFIKELIIKCDKLNFTDRIDEEVPKEVLRKLLKIPYFKQAYFEDGLTENEFKDHPSVRATCQEFSKRTLMMVDFVSERIKRSKRGIE